MFVLNLPNSNVLVNDRTTNWRGNYMQKRDTGAYDFKKTLTHTHFIKSNKILTEKTFFHPIDFCESFLHLYGEKRMNFFVDNSRFSVFFFR